MMLYLMQHGKALSKEENNERPLSGEGRKDTAKTGRFLKKNFLRPDIIWHSGKKRAEETAEIIRSTLSSPAELIMKTGLNPMDPAEPAAREIIPENRDLLLVGHLPFLNRLASLLLAGNEEESIIEFQQGSVLCLEKKEETRSFSARWFIIPEIIPEESD